MVFILGDRGFPPIRFEYKMASERNLVAEIYEEKFWVLSEECRFSISLKSQQNCSLNISATKYPSEAVLYSKRTGGYSLTRKLL